MAAARTLCSGPLRLVDSDQLLLDLPGGVDQLVEPPERHGLLLLGVRQVARLTGERSERCLQDSLHSCRNFAVVSK